MYTPDIAKFHTYLLFYYREKNVKYLLISHKEVRIRIQISLLPYWP